MKKHMFRIWFVVLFCQSILVAQTLTPQQEQQLIQNLDSTDPNVKYNAIMTINDDSVYEAMPKIESMIFSQNADVVVEMLDALYKFRSTELHDIAKQVLDSATQIEKKLVYEDYPPVPPVTNVYGLKARALEYLFWLGDYSDVAQLFEIINVSSFNLAWYGGDLLPLVIEHVPSYADSAKADLLQILHETSNKLVRWNAMENLVRIYGKGMYSDLVQSATADSDNSFWAMKLLSDLNYPDLHTLFIKELTNDPFWSYRNDCADSLLFKYGSPSDYAIVQQYALTESNDTARKYIGFQLEDFQPPVPSPSTPIPQMIDSLTAVKHQVYDEHWIGDANFVRELDNDLDNAQSHLKKRDSLEASKEVEKFQYEVNKEYKESTNSNDKRFVTVDGWKFLYYDDQYVIVQLINPPKRPIGTLSRQIDSLKAELKRQEVQKDIGGLLLTKDLELFIDQANSQLHHGDSSSAALNICLFELLVDETNELSDELKTKSYPTTYVNDQAYIQLFYLAKYILEELPQPREPIDLPEALDKELQHELEIMKNDAGVK